MTRPVAVVHLTVPPWSHRQPSKHEMSHPLHSPNTRENMNNMDIGRECCTPNHLHRMLTARTVQVSEEMYIDAQHELKNQSCPSSTTTTTSLLILPTTASTFPYHGPSQRRRALETQAGHQVDYQEVFGRRGSQSHYAQRA